MREYFIQFEKNVISNEYIRFKQYSILNVLELNNIKFLRNIYLTNFLNFI